jgi:hypothetical protein
MNNCDTDISLLSRSVRMKAMPTTTRLFAVLVYCGCVRSETSCLAALTVERSITQRVLGLHHFMNLSRALVDDRGTCISEISADS